MKTRSDKNLTPSLKNRKARFSYEIHETYEAGLVLKGTEVKSMREGKASMTDSFARLRGGELYLMNFHIEPYKQGSWTNENPTRPKKVLLHKREIKRLTGKMQERGLVLVPLKTYFKNGFAKVLLGLGRPKKLYDKREKIKKRQLEREMGRIAKGGHR
jgi:SsrA-binding protein